MFEMSAALDDAKSQLTRALNIARWLVAILFLALALKSWKDKDYLRSAVLMGAAVWLASVQIGGGGGAGGGPGGGGGGLDPGAGAALAAVAGGGGDAVVIPVGVDPTGLWVRLPSGALLSPWDAARALAQSVPDPSKLVVSLARTDRRAMIIDTYNLLSASLAVLGVRLATDYTRRHDADDEEIARGLLSGVRPDQYPASRAYDFLRYEYDRAPGTAPPLNYGEWLQSVFG